MSPEKDDLSFTASAHVAQEVAGNASLPPRPAMMYDTNVIGGRDDPPRLSSGAAAITLADTAVGPWRDISLSGVGCSGSKPGRANGPST